MKPHITMTALLLMAGCACGSPHDSDSAAPRDSGDSPTPDSQAPGVALSGQVVDGTGVPVTGADVQSSGDPPRVTTTDGEGRFLLADHPSGDAFLRVTKSQTISLASAAFPLVLEGDREIRVVLHDLDPAVTLPDQPEELSPSAGLWLTVGAGDLDPATATIAAAPMTLGYLPPFDHDGHPVAAWYLEPYGAVAAAGLPLRIEDAWGLHPGAFVLLWASEEQQAWVELGGIDDAMTLPALSTLVLVGLKT
jgi:hypothetical protein